MKFPNIRKVIIPDPGYVIFDCDLSGADAQVVAWEANDEELKDAFRKGLKVHAVNAKAMFGEDRVGPDGKKDPELYDKCKRAVHGTNYGGSAKTIASNVGWTIAQATRFQQQWFNLHPGIYEWHRRIDSQLQRERSVRNRFGYGITYFDRPNNLLPKGLAWVPQSTVAVTCSRGGRRLRSLIPECELLLQVHDSLVFQVRKSDLSQELLARIKNALSVVVPYDDPLVIPWEIAMSPKSWGDCQKIKWSVTDAELQELASSLHEIH